MAQETRPHRFIELGFLAALLVAVSWGCAAGAFQSLHAEGRIGKNAQQRALDRLFGGDVAFDPDAADVMTAAAGGRDSVNWRMLGRAKLEGMAVRYPADILALAGKSVRITGYMFPLQGAEGQSHFLLSAYPPSCPYCLPAGPAELIDVEAAEDVGFTYGALTVAGVFAPLEDKDDLANGFIYRLTSAAPVK